MKNDNSKTELRSQVAIQATATPPHRHWRLAVAGGMSGMFTNTVLHPLDTLKTLRQSDPKSFKGLAPTLFSIIRKKGPQALYSGIVPALIGSALSSAIYFGMYEYSKARMSETFPSAWASPRSRLPLISLSAASGNIASSVVFVPKEVLKQRLQFGKHGHTFLAVIVNLFKQSGIAGFYRGYRATLFRNIPSAMIRFAAYEEIKIAITRLRTDGDTGRTMSPHEFVLAGSLAGALSSACTTPMDLVKTGLATGVIEPGTSLPVAFREIVRKRGVTGLFIGIRPRIIWAALFAAIGFTSYEVCKAWLTGQPSPLKKGFLHSKRKVIVKQPYPQQKKVT